MSLVAKSKLSWTIARLRDPVLNFELSKIVLDDLLSHELRHLRYDLAGALPLQSSAVLP